MGLQSKWWMVGSYGYSDLKGKMGSPTRMTFVWREASIIRPASETKSPPRKEGKGAPGDRVNINDTGRETMILDILQREAGSRPTHHFFSVIR